METRASYVTVGAFVVICIAGLFTAMLWVAGAQYREEYTYYRTYFTGPVTGLGKGTVVRYNGIDAGNVAISPSTRPIPSWSSSPCRSIPHCGCMWIRSPPSRVRD